MRHRLESDSTVRDKIILWDITSTNILCEYCPSLDSYTHGEITADTEAECIYFRSTTRRFEFVYLIEKKHLAFFTVDMPNLLEQFDTEAEETDSIRVLKMILMNHEEVEFNSEKDVENFPILCQPLNRTMSLPAAPK